MLNVLLPVFTHNPPPPLELENLTETCLRSWDWPLNCVDYPNYNPDSGSGGLYVCTALGVIVHVFQRILIFFIFNYITIFFGFNRLNSMKKV